MPQAINNWPLSLRVPPHIGLITDTKLITTEEVLVELFEPFSEYGERARRGAVTQAEGILSGANIDVARHGLQGLESAAYSTVTFPRLDSFNKRKPALRGLVRLESGN